MKKLRATLKNSFHRWIVALLLFANLGAFAFADRFFSTRTGADKGQDKALISKVYTGWQMLDYTFSFIGRFSNVGENKE